MSVPNRKRDRSKASEQFHALMQPLSGRFRIKEARARDHFPDTHVDFGLPKDDDPEIDGFTASWIGGQAQHGKAI